mmetsp:Transcript_24078/g.80923  ORF Transcript_24078/g.80923 Transcript_24078/m.80923 type:complete len:254 (-) Transcript_24078:1995-2756(-)
MRGCDALPARGDDHRGAHPSALPCHACCCSCRLGSSSRRGHVQEARRLRHRLLRGQARLRGQAGRRLVHARAEDTAHRLRRLDPGALLRLRVHGLRPAHLNGRHGCALGAHVVRPRCPPERPRVPQRNDRARRRRRGRGRLRLQAPGPQDPRSRVRRRGLRGGPAAPGRGRPGAHHRCAREPRGHRRLRAARARRRRALHGVGRHRAVLRVAPVHPRARHRPPVRRHRGRHQPALRDRGGPAHRRAQGRDLCA